MAKKKAQKKKKSLIAYKVFRRGVTSLMGRYTSDETLQKVGDTATAKGPLKLCSNGWHAFHLKNLSDWWMNESCGLVLFKVRLEGGILHGPDKLCARKITLIERISPKEAKRLYTVQQAEIERLHKIYEKISDEADRAQDKLLIEFEKKLCRKYGISYDEYQNFN